MLINYNVVLCFETINLNLQYVIMSIYSWVKHMISHVLKFLSQLGQIKIPSMMMHTQISLLCNYFYLII